MATLIPEFLPARSPKGEHDLARILKRLPEDWIIYHEPNIEGRHPDFVILAPDLGVLVIEVKDWQMGTIHSLDSQSVELRPASSPDGVRKKNPFIQVREYWQAVVKKCESDRFGRDLIASEGKWKGHLCFPVGSLVIFTRISAARVDKSPHAEVWKSIFNGEKSVLSDALVDWEKLESDALAAELKPYFRPFNMRERFTARQIDVLRWVLFPESRMDVILRRDRADHEQIIEVLDARQEQHARSLGSGHRILSGVAGSGKTVLLLARARHLALAYPGQKTLLLCYNKVLAEWLRARIADCPSVTVRHFDGWAKEQKLARRPTDKDDAAFGARVLDALQKRGAAAREWDTVLIDEAQDFEPTWFQCALAAMHDPENGDLVIVADGSQRLYKRNGLSWKAIGIKAAGRTISARYDLDKNYRNTPVIAALAHGFSDEELNDDGINARRVGPNTCRRTNYSKPVLVEAGDHASQVDAAIEIVARWIRGERAGHSATPIRPEDIGIFYPKLGRNSRLLDQLIAGLARLAPTRWLSDKSDPLSHQWVNEKAIKVQTVHSAKGLQYKAVLVLWTDMLPVGTDATDEERRLLYVAITRAENDLVLLGSGAGSFDLKFKETCAVRRFPFAPQLHAVA